MPTLAEHINWHLKLPQHGWIVRGVRDTPPLTARDDGVILLSMVGTASVLPYLVAVKTFALALGRGRVVIVDDGTLTPRDRDLLAWHLADPRIIAIDAVDTGPCPRGGTWERLLTILDLRRDAYVIQLDSDTLTLGAVPEVAAAIDAGRCFTLRGEESAQLLAADDFVARLAPENSRHVQRAIEQAIDRTGIARYVRGCSGFAGFAPSSEGRAVAESFSRAAEGIVGTARWREWGTEQVTSNVVVANSADPLLLPYDRYRNFWNDGVPAGVGVMHFVGTCRFDGRTYLDETRAAIRRLAAA